MEDQVTTIFETVICIPGTWKTWQDFLLTIIEVTKGEYIAAGGILMNASRQKHYVVEFCDRDERMQSSFKAAGAVNSVSEAFLEQIGNHNSVIYISAPTGNPEEAYHIAEAAKAVLASGGLGIKIETAGKAFEPEQWNELLQNFEDANLYRMFVIDSILDKDGAVFSCGMQNLGLKDTIVYGEEFQDAVDLISIFGYYQVVEKPVILNGQTFSVSMEAPKYVIAAEEDQPYEGDELFGNPFGMWRLDRM